MSSPNQHRNRKHKDAATGVIAAVLLVLGLGCSQRDKPADKDPSGDKAAASDDAYRPLAAATASLGKVENREAPVPAMCYTKTGGESNPCWVCHTSTVGHNHLSDWELQLEYSFSDQALTNHWTNLFIDRRPAIAGISNDEILAYVRQDNYKPLREALAKAPKSYPGYRPDIDLDAGFDDDGFARDGSDWRAIRYHPFLGSFWPTNGSTDDVFIRLPKAFRSDQSGKPSREIYKLNLAILEAVIAGKTAATKGAVDFSVLYREVEPVDERLIDFDLDGDGKRKAGTTLIKHLPETYAGGASEHKVRAGLYPRGTEFLHSVRYIDPDVPTLMARRMKELRYAKKVMELDNWAILRAYEEEEEHKNRGHLPTFRGSPHIGLLNDFGWQLQGFIEDARGRLRLQTEEEHLFCMGCHSAIGVTVDHTFSFARKVPGKGGWRVHDLRGLKDRPQVGQLEPEILTYFRRVAGADEFRANDEMLARFFPKGVLAEAQVRRAAVGGDRDLAWLLSPSRERGLALNKAYLVVVREQSFTRGRDPVLSPATRVHDKIENGSTDLARAKKVFLDGRLHLVWAHIETKGLN